MKTPQYYDGDGQYEYLDEDVEKRERRRELRKLMDEYLAAGGKIRQVGVKSSPKPRFKYLNRRQKKLRNDEGEE